MMRQLCGCLSVLPRLIVLCLKVFICLLPLNGFSNQDFTNRIYQIELYVFSQGGGLNNLEEAWLPTQVDRGLGDAIALLEGDQYFEGFAVMPTEQIIQPEILNGLGSSHRYRLLYQAAWQQKVPTKLNAIPILIQGGRQYDSNYFELDGKVMLYLSRYLHFSVDLALNDYVSATTPLSTEGWDGEGEMHKTHLSNSSIDENAEAGQTREKEEGENESWQLNQQALMIDSRRMRSGEIHYLDHPALGVVIVIHHVI